MQLTSRRIWGANTFLYATSLRARSLRPIKVPSDQNTLWRLSFSLSTNKRQEILVSPISWFTYTESGRISPRRRTCATNKMPDICSFLRNFLIGRRDVRVWHWVSTCSFLLAFFLFFLFFLAELKPASITLFWNKVCECNWKRSWIWSQSVELMVGWTHSWSCRWNCTLWYSIPNNSSSNLLILTDCGLETSKFYSPVHNVGLGMALILDPIIEFSFRLDYFIKNFQWPRITCFTSFN